MRTAITAGLIAGTLFLPFTALAAQGSSLRGLKAPLASWEKLAMQPSSSREGLKHTSSATAFELAPRTAFYAGTLDSRSVILNETDLKFGLYRPLAAAPLLGEGSVNPLFDTVPKYSLYSQVMQPLGGGFGLGIGMRRSEYNFAGANLLALSAEQSIGSFRGGYTLYSHRNDLIGAGAAHRFQFSYAYGDRNTVGLAYTTGRDIDNLNLPVGVPLGASPADVRDLSLSGRHWLSTNWALTYDVQTQTQESALRRQGLRLGVSRSF